MDTQDTRAHPFDPWEPLLYRWDHLGRTVTVLGPVVADPVLCDAAVIPFPVIRIRLR